MTQANGKTESLKSLQAQRQLAETKLEILRLQHAQRIAEDMMRDSFAPPAIFYRPKGKNGKPRQVMEDIGGDSWFGGFGGPDSDFGGSDTFIRARADGGFSFVPISVPSDRRHGQRWPVWRTEPELDRIRQQGRLLLAVNSYAQGLIRNRTNYTIGKGFAYKCVAKGTEKGEDVPEAVQKLRTKTQDCVDDFLRINRWNSLIDPTKALVLAGTRERECYQRVEGGDGEAFIRFYREENGRTIIRFLAPERVRMPPGGTPADGWSFGIRHQMQPFEDVETPIEYFAFWQDPSTVKPTDSATAVGEFIPADEILHLKGMDTPADVKRGITPFCFDTARALERASKLQRNISIGAGVRAATAEIWKAANTTQQQMSAFQGNMQTDLTVDPLTQQTIQWERRNPGMIRRIPDHLEPVIPPADQSTGGYVQAAQGDLRQGSAAFASPEYWTGSTENGNYSNLETASAPPVKNGEAEQEYYKMAFLAVVWKAVAWAIEKGQLPREVMTLIDIQVEAPAVLHRNELEKAQADQIKVQMGSKSPQTCAMEDGLDPEIELANTEEFKERTGGAGLPLELPAEGDSPGVQKPDEGHEVLGPAKGAEQPEQPTETPDAAQGQSPAPDTDNSLRATVGGLNAIAALQSDYYGGKVPREAAIANAKLLFGFADAEADSLFPEIAPTKLSPDNGPDPDGNPDFGESLTEGDDDTPGVKAAKNAVGAALKSGKLKKGKCAGCGTTEGVEAHHKDHRKPLEVTWLCSSCHHKKTYEGKK